MDCAVSCCALPGGRKYASTYQVEHCGQPSPRHGDQVFYELDEHGSRLQRTRDALGSSQIPRRNPRQEIWKAAADMLQRGDRFIEIERARLDAAKIGADGLLSHAHRLGKALLCDVFVSPFLL